MKNNDLQKFLSSTASAEFSYKGPSISQRVIFQEFTRKQNGLKGPFQEQQEKLQCPFLFSLNAT